MQSPSLAAFFRSVILSPSPMMNQSAPAPPVNRSRSSSVIPKLREAGVDVPDADELTYSAIVGEVELVDVVPYDAGLLPDDYELPDDPWATGPVCWILANPVPYDEPIPCRGQPGIWEWGGV